MAVHSRSKTCFTIKPYDARAARMVILQLDLLSYQQYHTIKFQQHHVTIYGNSVDLYRSNIVTCHTYINNVHVIDAC